MAHACSLLCAYYIMGDIIQINKFSHLKGGHLIEVLLYNLFHYEDTEAWL